MELSKPKNSSQNVFIWATKEDTYWDVNIIQNLVAYSLELPFSLILKYSNSSFQSLAFRGEEANTLVFFKSMIMNVLFALHANERATLL